MSVLSLARAVVAEARRAEVSFLAAAVAYYAFVSLVPLLLLGLALGSLVGGEAFAAALVGAMGDLLTPAGEDVVVEAILGATGRGGATVFGLAVLLWSGLKLFRSVSVAFARIYGVESEGLFQQVRDGLVTFAAVNVAVGAAVVLGGVLPALDVLPGPASVLPLVVALAAAFFPLYYLLPAVPTTAREALPGAAFAAVGWTVLTAAFGVYAANAARFALYGVLGAVLLLVTWLYLAGNIIMVGGILNAVLAGRTDADPDSDEPRDEQAADGPAPDIAALDREVRDLRERVEERTVSRSALEGDLRQYVRRELRRGHARGWGPYLVLLYGTVMTVGAFYFLAGAWAILAMLVVWLSTLGLYVLMVLVGVGVSAAGVPGRLADWVRARRS
ncbi:MAG: YihY/virulence factor BrkB family protein [Halobacteriaceae archaeon]